MEPQFEESYSQQLSQISVLQSGIDYADAIQDAASNNGPNTSH